MWLGRVTTDAPVGSIIRVADSQAFLLKTEENADNIEDWGNKCQLFIASKLIIFYN